MSDNLSQFLVDLASDPATMAAWLADPDRMCEEAGLNSHERAVIQSRDPRLMSRTVGAAMQFQPGHDTAKPPKGGKKKKPAKKKSGTKKR